MKRSTLWRDDTIRLLRDRPASLTTDMIADHIGVTRSWLNLLVAGKIQNPGVVYIESLNKFLTEYKPN